MRILIALALAAAPSLAQECPWKEPLNPLHLKAEESTIRLQGAYDRAWFQCAKKAGGSITTELWLGHGGKLEKVREKAQGSSEPREAAHVNDLCDAKPKRDQAQVKIVGKGAMEKASWTSEIASVHCARCDFRGDDNMLVLHANTRGDEVVFEGTVDEEWQKCALAGSTLEGRFYTGNTRQEVEASGTPAFVLNGLEKDRHFKRGFSRKEICKGSPKYVAYDLVGTGEMAGLNNKGRGIDDPRCGN